MDIILRTRFEDDLFGEETTAGLTRLLDDVRGDTDEALVGVWLGFRRENHAYVGTGTSFFFVRSAANSPSVGWRALPEGLRARAAEAALYAQTDMHMQMSLTGHFPALHGISTTAAYSVLVMPRAALVLPNDLSRSIRLLVERDGRIDGTNAGELMRLVLPNYESAHARFGDAGRIAAFGALATGICRTWSDVPEGRAARFLFQ